MEENDVKVEVLEETVETGKVVEEGFFARAKRRAKKLIKPVGIAAIGIGGAILGGALSKKKAYKQGYIDGGADMYESHVYPEEGVEFDPEKTEETEETVE